MNQQSVGKPISTKDYPNINWPGVQLGLSTKRDGSMRLSSDGSPDNEAVLNRKTFFDKLDVDVQRVVSAGLTHGKAVAVVADADCGHTIPETDGLITDRPEVFLTITVADCVPIYFYDPIYRAIGIAHSGWKGTLQNVAGGTINALQKQYHSTPEHISVYCGPHIQTHHFEAREGVADQFKLYQEHVHSQGEKLFIDLGSIIQKQLLDVGVLKTNIHISERCTVCDERDYFSFRRDKPRKLQTMVAYIGLT